MKHSAAKPPFESIVERHGVTVLRVCRAALGPHDADDAWSETFLSALRAYPDLPADANVEAWLVRIAHRKAIDLYRAAGRRALPAGNGADLDDVRSGQSAGSRDGTAPGPFDAQGDLWQAIVALPERQRLAVAYHHLAGLPYAEVAAEIGGTPEAVRRAAADGMKKLRKVML
ncbi:RNA polymerase sigma factor [Zhihengliuella sp.]|uniref:RNA polymerase sigma factor n=1 Tax=Zhihengliuella sp. TaxID=1954483 RepID=UPI0028110097|nr:RNA polymerase sigma factor [Zhihengliuella sp.]